MATLAAQAQIAGLVDALAAKADLADVGASVVTAWVAYTPTIVGAGTVSGVLFRSRRVRDTLEVVGRFTSGTSTAVGLTVTLGHAGVNGGILVSNIQSSRALVGSMAYNVASAAQGCVLAIAADDLVKFGLQDGTAGGLTPRNGNVLISSGSIMTMQFAVPIQGWT